MTSCLHWLGDRLAIDCKETHFIQLCHRLLRHPLVLEHLHIFCSSA
jgi:hypothetical protein